MTKHPLANKIEINDAKSIVEKLAYQLVNKILQCDLTMMPLLDISNDWISPDIFPENWVIEIVTPIFKSGKKIITNKLSVNFCTIMFLKISERIMYIQVYNYLNNKNLLFHKPFGFRKCHSTDHALIGFINSIYHSFNQKKYIYKQFPLIYQKLLILLIIIL